MVHYRPSLTESTTLRYHNSVRLTCSRYQVSWSSAHVLRVEDIIRSEETTLSSLSNHVGRLASQAVLRVRNQSTRHITASLVLSVPRLPERSSHCGRSSHSDSHRDSYRDSHRDSHRDQTEHSNSLRTVLARRHELIVSCSSLAIVEEERDQ